MYQVDAFTEKIFSGNPAAVCVFGDWPADAALQAIAAENNLSETAFLVKRENFYDLRWFTPLIEIDLCGHATLASAFIVFTYLEPGLTVVDFSTRSGMLRVEQAGDLLGMDFPARKPAPAAVDPLLVEALGVAPREAHRARDLLVILDSEQAVRGLKPDMDKLARLADCLGIIVSARGEAADFVSRFFAPAAGIPEDPVTGSSHCTLIPFWAERLGKTRLHALQVSRRGGELFCEDRGERVRISGRAVLFSEGTIHLPEVIDAR